MRVLVCSTVVFMLLLAGCLAEPGEPVLPGAGDATDATTPPVVVAVLDTGANPYHKAFRGGPGFEDVPGFPADARALNLTLDASRYGDAAAADAALWDTIEQGELVWFPGTRLAAVSFGAEAQSPDPLDDGVTNPRHLVLDENGHGTATSHAVIAASDHVAVVMVQVPDDEQLADGLQWVAAQSWIDVVSVSWGTWLQEYADDEASMGLPAAYAEAARAGKLVLNSAGNEPVPHMMGEHSGPPFVVAVGGAENATHGETRLAARFPDVLGAMWQTLALPGSLDAYADAGGTSFACPYVAGSVADALWRVRNATGGGAGDGALVLADGDGALGDGRLTADELRDAMNARAEYWGPTDWEPPSGVNDDLLMSNPIVHPASQMGWGYVAPDQSEDVAAILLGAMEAPEKPADAVAFMHARQTARAAVWGTA